MVFFSNIGENIGVCIVKADDKDSAYEKIDNLGLLPKYDDIFCQELNDLDDDPLLDFNIFYSTDEMLEKGYQTKII